jgi:hypothetical protein
MHDIYAPFFPAFAATLVLMIWVVVRFFWLVPSTTALF